MRTDQEDCVDQQHGWNAAQVPLKQGLRGRQQKPRYSYQGHLKDWQTEYPSRGTRSRPAARPSLVDPGLDRLAERNSHPQTRKPPKPYLAQSVSRFAPLEA